MSQHCKKHLQPHLPQLRFSFQFKMHLLLMFCCGGLSKHWLSLMDAARSALGSGSLPACFSCLFSAVAMLPIYFSLLFPGMWPSHS